MSGWVFPFPPLVSITIQTSSTLRRHIDIEILFCETLTHSLFLCWRTTTHTGSEKSNKPNALEYSYSKCTSVHITRVFVKNTGPQGLLQTYWPKSCILTRFQGDLFAQYCCRPMCRLDLTTSLLCDKNATSSSLSFFMSYTKMCQGSQFFPSQHTWER